MRQSLLLIFLLSALLGTAAVWQTDTVLGGDFKMHTVEMPDDYSGHVRSTVVKLRSDCADSTAVLYIHGYNDYFFQRDEAERLADSCYHFYAVDLRKYGRSILLGQQPYELRDVKEYYADIDSAVALMRHDGIRHAVLMGHSTGGLVASSYMANHPDSIFNALVLNSPFLDWNMSAFKRKVAVPVIGFLSRLFPHMKISQGSRPSPYGESLLRGSHGEWDFNTDWKTIMPRKVESSWINAITSAQRDVRKGRIRVPVLLMRSDKSVTGDEWTPAHQRGDAVLNVDHMHAIAPRLGADVTETVVPDALHDIFLSSEPVREDAYSKLFGWLRRRHIKN